METSNGVDFECLSSREFWSFFYKLDEIGNDANIGIRDFTMWKQKIPVTKCYPQCVLNPWTSDSKSNTPFWANLACAT